MKPTKKRYVRPGTPPKVTKFNVIESAELMDFISEKLKGKSRTGIKSLLSNKQVYVDDRAVTQYNFMLHPGQVVSISSEKAQKAISLKGLKIIYEDEYIIVINKEAGILSIASENEKLNTAYGILSNYVEMHGSTNKVFIVHRLDRDVSGLMVFAKDSESKFTLQNMWHTESPERVYTAVVHGRVTKTEETIISWLTENQNFQVFSSPNPNGGQKAVTSYKLIEAQDHCSLLEIRTETGKKNQIRVHLQDIDHPALGDKKYGGQRMFSNRIYIHANFLKFEHPVTKKEMEFTSPLPQEFKTVMMPPAPEKRRR